jgi:NAD(P)-dependent dehydrogenase (short-subunit alcohol dehydrogenase family)
MDEPSWVEDHIPPLPAKTAIITGANSGIGYEAARVLASRGVQVIMACRNAQKAETARQEILSQHPDAHLETMELNLSDLSSVQEFALHINERYNQLDLLINNAGVMALPYSTTVDGFEMQFGTNHLGHFALTAQLFPLLRDTPASRIINIASAAHQYGKIDFDNLNFENGGYGKWPAYCRSKLSNLLFTFELDRRIKANGLNMLAVSAHPGYSATALQEKGINYNKVGWRQWMVETGNRLLATSPLFGALPTLYAASKESIHGGEYIGPVGFLNMRGEPGPNPSSYRSRDPQVAARLWKESEQLTRISFPLEYA